MKIRWTSRSLRVRLDDLEVAALLRGERLEAALNWPGGGWTVLLDPHSPEVVGEGPALSVGLLESLEQLADPNTEGVRLDGPMRIDVQKDYRPEHLK